MVSNNKTPKTRLPSNVGSVVYEKSPRWIRGYLGDTKIVDSKNTYLIWEGATPYPNWAFPTQDIAGLVKNNHVDGGKEGLRGQWFNVKTGDKTVENFGFVIKNDTPGFIEEANELVVVELSKLDKWLEDDEQVIGHAADPYHRIDARLSSRHVKVVIDGVTIAETQNAVFLYESALITRYYINTIDVKRLDLFRPSTLNTVCPYKGVSSYFSATVNGKDYPNIAWTYFEPFAGLEKITGRWAFYNEKLDIYVDGEKQTYD
ncbi:hypothetical protein BGW37DRAFT_488864 [Umbelopsis sp. PMI_123]|nr:hypothetical protein BGW37DRAFT_488864 [Umbelopsis sp. PMI_123]